MIAKSNGAAAAVARLLHVANGTMTTRLIEAAGIGGATSIWADPLHEGPVPGGLSDRQLLSVRASHIAGSDDDANVVEELARWRSVIAAHSAYDELVLWFEHDLFDQLNLIQLLSYLSACLPPYKPVSLVCIDSFPGRWHFKGLGELEPRDIASLLPARRTVTRAQYGIANAAWLAFRASIPTHLEDFLRGDTSALPYLAPALRRHLQEFPWTLDGLTRTERRLLILAANGPVDIRAAFTRMHDDETVFFIADGSFWSIVRDLASASPPLIEIRPGEEEKKDEDRLTLPRGTMALTDPGRAVLAGADRIAVCGIDRWLGGVHVSELTGVWRWDPSGGRLVATSQPSI